MFKKRLSLTSITAGFSKVVADLEALKAQNKADIATHNAKIAELQGTIGTLQTEHDQAHAVHTNISALLKTK